MAKQSPTKILFLLVFWTSSAIHATKEKGESLSYVFTKGDFMIGGLSPVHFSPTEAEEQQNPDSLTCQGGLNTRGFEAVEAMLFTMDMLNEGPLKDVVLPNITIGMDIKDTCGSADYAVRESLNFSFIRNAYVQEQCSGLQRKKGQQTIAVVGAAYSGVSMAVANLCGLFYVPVISYASTSSLLSNNVRFRFFLRTVPNDILQAQVMADLVRALKSNYVVTLASDNEYGRSGIESFKFALENNGNAFDVCIPVQERFTKRSTDEHFDAIFRNMKANPKAKVVVLFAQLHDADILIRKFRQQNLVPPEGYVWIGSDAWADSEQILKGNERILNRMFGVVPEVVHIKKFDKYFTDFNDKRRKRNPWMREYEYLKVAHDPAFHRQTFTHYPKAQYVMDAVLAAAYTLHNMLGCKPYRDCSDRITWGMDVKNILSYLQKVRFPGMSRDTFSFDNVGDAIGVYDIKHLKLVGANYEFVNVGKWGAEACDVRRVNHSSKPCLELDYTMIDNKLRNYTDKGVPFSSCSRDCPMGSHKSPEKNHAKCCWQCRPCTRNTVTNKTNMDECMPCPRGYWTNSNHSRCEPIQPTTLQWSDTLGVIIICLSGAGVWAVICTFVVYYIYRETPVVKASSRELCYVLLFGIAWCFLTPLLFLADRTDVVCRAIPFVTGLSPSLIAGTLLTKTNRVSRIFNRKLLKTGTPSFLSKKWQLLMVICLAVVECLICGGCVIFNDTGSKLMIFDSKKEVLKQCKAFPDICTASWWVYNAGLAITCTYQAFRTRKLPENYNEAKFISFTMIVSCIVVTIFIPTYIGTQGTYRTTITCFVFIIVGFSTLCCMFVPKLYIILWRPEKNVQMQPRTSTIRLGTISPSTSFVRRLSVDSTVDTTKDVRSTRINFLPAIQLNRDDDNRQNCDAGNPPFRKTRRSYSLSPDALQRTGRYGAGGSPALGRHSRNMSTHYHISMEMIEETSECENCNEILLEGQDLEQTKADLNCIRKPGYSSESLDIANGEYSEYSEIDALLSLDGDTSNAFGGEENTSQVLNSTTCSSLGAGAYHDKGDPINCNGNVFALRQSSFLESLFGQLDLICRNCNTKFQSVHIRKEDLVDDLYRQVAQNKANILKLNTPKEPNKDELRTADFETCNPCERKGQKRKKGVSKSQFEATLFHQRIVEEDGARECLDVNKNGLIKRPRNHDDLLKESSSLPSLSSPLQKENQVQLYKTENKRDLNVPTGNHRISLHFTHGGSLDSIETSKGTVKCYSKTNEKKRHVTNGERTTSAKQKSLNLTSSDEESETHL